MGLIDIENRRAQHFIIEKMNNVIIGFEGITKELSKNGT